MPFTKRLIIHGLVQGVGYRFSMVNAARANSVTGWVRNRRDGTVEALIQGEQNNIDKIIQWSHMGPPSAKVTQVEVIDEVGTAQYSDFTQQPTE